MELGVTYRVAAGHIDAAAVHRPEREQQFVSVLGLYADTRSEPAVGLLVRRGERAA